MHNYSENWHHLKSILTGYTTKNNKPESYSYSDHTHAKALSIFLAHATLATPKLDRETVDAVLAGRLAWPHTLHSPAFEGGSLQLSLLEEYGFVAFYANWCSVHCQPPRSLDDIDQSLIPLVQSIEHLKDICHGRNGYIQPHYTCPAEELKRLLTASFGSALVTELIPELCLENDYFKLPPGNQSFSALVSTYLWRTLCERFESRDAFERWILCLRVNCEWAFPVLFGDGEYELRAEFNNQLVAYLAQDAGLGITTDTLRRQTINESGFRNIVMPVSTQLNISIDAGMHSHSEHQDIIELEKPTLTSLSTAYPPPNPDDSDNLLFVSNWQQARYWQEPQLFYTWLLNCSIEANIHIDGQLLASHGFTEKVIELAESRPALKHLLFNLLPIYGSVAYRIFLLSQPETCDIAIFYLAQHSFFNTRQDSEPFAQYFVQGYQNLVCHEYLRAIEKESDSGGRLLRVVAFLGDRCNLHARDFAKNTEYAFLLCFLEKLSHPQAAQLGQELVQLYAREKNKPTHQRPQHFWYLLGFWLIEHLESFSIDPTGTLICTLRKNLLHYYKVEFEENLAGKLRTLEANDFFSALPWQKLIGNEDILPILALSNNCDAWKEAIRHSNNVNFSVVSAIRHYLQVLMSTGRLQRSLNNRIRIDSRVVEIVRTLGFGSSEKATHLFDAVLYPKEYDLWSPFCSYTNQLKDELYDELVDRCFPLVPLNQLFVLLERCTVISRTQKLQEIIAIRQSLDFDDLGLSSLEQAFISAWDANHTDLASKLIDTAKAFLGQDRFIKSNNPHILKARKAWLSYEYQYQLLTLSDSFKSQPKEYAEAAHKVQIPHERPDNSMHESDREHWKECEQFRRYIIAAAYRETDPARCVMIMEQLCKESKSRNFKMMLFNGHLSIYEINKNTTELRHALSHLMDNLRDIDPEYMPSLWVATILYAYFQLQDSVGIDDFWKKLNPDQQNRREVLSPYCKALMARGDALIAQQIITHYRELNHQASDELGIKDLIDELIHVLPSNQSMSQLVQVINEDSQRSTVQLAKHYNQIVSKEFKEYVAIVGQGLQPHEFLRTAVTEVANELLLRKKNLQIHSTNSNDKTNFRITQEDLINDWFTSLFDKRMTEARIGFRDQKRAGQSESGKNPGEIDGYITDAKNNRIAIFEAFRLFSLDTTVITDHLNKISIYDNESLSPVFIAAYCDVSDFAELVQRYPAFIAKQSYAGFTIDSATGGEVQTLDQNKTNHLWLGMEQRRRNDREVIFYHLLLNMHFEA